MSVGRPNLPNGIPTDPADVVIGDQLYQTNRARIDQVQEYLNTWRAMNEQGKKNYTQIQMDLVRKVQEGEEALRQLEALQNPARESQLAILPSGSTPTSQPVPAASHPQRSRLVPITATIEEVTSSPPNIRTSARSGPQTRRMNATESLPRSSNSFSRQSTDNSTLRRSKPINQNNESQRGAVDIAQRQSQQQYGETAWPQYQSQPVAPFKHRPYKWPSQGHEQQPAQVQQQQLRQPSQPVAVAIPMPQYSYYRPNVYGQAADGVTSTSSSLAGALGTLNQNQPSSSFTPFQWGSLASTSQPVQSSIVHNGHVPPSQHPGQVRWAPVNNLAPQVSASANQSHRTGTSLSQSNNHPVALPTSSSTSASATKPVQSTLLHSANLSNVHTSRDSNDPSVKSFKQRVLDWALHAAPNTYLDIPDSALKFYKDPKTNQVLTGIWDANGQFISYDEIEPTQRPSPTSGPKTNVRSVQESSGNLSKSTTAPAQQNSNSSSAISRTGLPQSDTTPNLQSSPGSAQVSTPVKQVQGTLRTPAQAEKANLAKNILRALGHSSVLKRPRPDEESHEEITGQPPAKRQAIESNGIVPMTSVNPLEARVSSPVPESAAPGSITVPQRLEEKEANSEELPASGAAQASLEQNQMSENGLKTELDGFSIIPPMRPVPPTPNAFPAQRPPPQRSALFTSISKTMEEHLTESRSKGVTDPTSVTLHTSAEQAPSISIAPTSVNSVHSTPTSSTATSISRGQVTNGRRIFVENNLLAMPSTSSSSKIPNSPPIASPPRQRPYVGHTAQNKMPLFFPSPSESPPRIGPGDTLAPLPLEPDDLSFAVDDLNGAMAGGEDQSTWGQPGSRGESTSDVWKKVKKRTQVYVLMPPTPEYVKRDLSKMAGQRKMTKSKTRGRRWVNEEDESDENSPVVSRRHEGMLPAFGFPVRGNNVNPDDPTEMMAVQETSSRLRERPCLWNGCDVVMNSADTLVMHLSQHCVQKTHKSTSISCLWRQCGARFSDRHKFKYHLQSHGLTPLYCAFQDCDESFRTARQLVQHNLFEHKNDFLRPSVDLFKPRMPPSLPPAPDVLPSYMVEARSVTQASIPSERHKVLCERVLRNIFGPVRLGSKKHNAAHPLRSSRRDASDVQGVESHQYDFLASSSSTKAPEFDDLNSIEVSQLASEGLVLWHVAERPKDSGSNRNEVVEVLSQAVTEVDGEPESEVKAGYTGYTDAGVSTPHSDEAVEIMLIGD